MRSSDFDSPETFSPSPIAKKLRCASALPFPFTLPRDFVRTDAINANIRGIDASAESNIFFDLAYRKKRNVLFQSAGSARYLTWRVHMDW